MHDHKIAGIDLVVVNLYPFEATVARGADFPTCVENIDIGGPALIRASAKNHDFVTVVVDPADYPSVIGELSANKGATTLALRRKLAARPMPAPLPTIQRSPIGCQARGRDFPRATDRLRRACRRCATARTRINRRRSIPTAASDRASPRRAWSRARNFPTTTSRHRGGYECVAEFRGPAVVVVKHANPCGGDRRDQYSAYLKAHACDPVSIFGGIVAVNTTLEARTAEDLSKLFLEVVIAPDATAEALAVMAKRKNVRVLLAGTLPDPSSAGMTLKSVGGGYLLQTRDNGRVTRSDLKVVTSVPTGEPGLVVRLHSRKHGSRTPSSMPGTAPLRAWARAR
jgi:phosphoribosylaminoimidazolecarboxamide formyltransferase/IMP cyclohydrolase